jgi:hypothetical protein
VNKAKYLLLLLLITACSQERQFDGPEMWEVKGDCIKLAKLTNANPIIFEEENSEGLYRVVCQLAEEDGKSYSRLYGNESKGAIRGIELYTNKDLRAAFNKCIKKNKLPDHFPSHNHYVVYRKCKDKVGWMN